MSRSNPTRRFAALLLAVALLAAPAVVGAAPVSTDATASWTFSWDGLAGLFASWFGWGDDTASVQGELGPTLDPDGQRVSPDDDTHLLTTEDPDPTAELGPTLDPDG